MTYIYKVVNYNIKNPKRLHLKWSKPLEYQTKGTMYKRGLFTGD